MVGINALLKAFAASTVASISVADAATAEQWRGRTIYQVLTDRFARPDNSTTATCNTSDREYCGGTWRGIINQLDYIKDMGFTAIWTSPITYNFPNRSEYGDPYHGYWQQDLYRLNPKFGTPDDLKALSQAVHDKDMYLMVDIAPNHFGWPGPSNSTDYSLFNPFNDAKYFHSYCPVDDYDNQTNVEECWLGDEKVELVDVNTEDPAVVEIYNTWIEDLISNYSIDGLRIDTAKHVSKSFWSTFQSSASVFCLAEVFNEDVSYACDYQNHLDGILDFPLYYWIIDFLGSTSGSTYSLVNNIGNLRSSCKDVSLMGTFVENHDLQRLAYKTNDMALAKNGLAFTILWDGIPVVYAGQEQHYAGGDDPANREATWLSGYSRESELYKLAAAVNQVRNYASYLDPAYLSYNASLIYTDDKTIAFRKGYDENQIVSVITNKGDATQDWTLSLENTGWGVGTAVIEILTCETTTIGDDGNLVVPMSSGLPRAYFEAGKASNGSICSG
ncbi:glycoside hydrolase family 13 protein [Lophiostoma macrostomum CBS 122681]|uniref:alpha-amylase n=1 Tax=Lophiostoma macrostomum CBS 122681 TaxID=1314788 RepID=A0A6A6T3C4_9PLEO|nr:glycoside hydrolase family 13 protein [Lophiostoma macrostomum CBS 122681]